MKRHAKLSDAAQIAVVHLLSWKETYTGIVDQDLLDRLDESKKIKIWQNVLKDPNQVVWVYEEDQTVLGFADFYFDVSKKVGELRAIYLLKKIQAKGVGLELMQQGLALLKQKQCHLMKIEVFDRNPSRDFYEKLGARCVAVEDASNYGNGLKVLHYQLNI